MSKILIVDDETEILNPLEEMLQEEGFEVRAFTNPLKALDFLRTQSVDLAIFDLFHHVRIGCPLLSRVSSQS